MGKHRWSSRHCFSDSEIDGFEVEGMAINKSKARSKCTSEDCLDTRLSPDCAEYLKGRILDDSRSGCNSEKSSKKCKNKVRPSHKKNKMPEWISSIFRIAKEGKVEKMKMSLKDMDGALVRNLSDCNGNNLWHVACSRNHLSCVQWLCTQFGQVALTDENKHGLTPVVSAVKRGSLSVLQWLLQKKYDQGLGIPTDGKRTLLHFAAKYGQVEILEWLVSYFVNMGYDLTSKDADGNTAMHLAAKYGHIQCVKNIILEGGDLTARNNFGYKPYDLATSNRQVACSEYLIALEACFSLSTGSYLLESDLQRFQIEIASTRKHFKELQQLMRTSIYHQKELLETFRAACRESQLLEEEANEQSAESEKGEEQSAIRQGFQNRLKEEFDRWYSNALLKDEATFHLLEDKWKRQYRRGNKHTIENKNPLKIVRSQFAQVFAKASSSSSVAEINIATSDSSLSEDSSEDETDLHRAVELSHAPSALPAFLEEIQLNEMLNEAASFPIRTNKHSTPGHGYNPVKRRGPLSSRLPLNHNRRTCLPAQPQLGASLKTLFERNPELKQEGQTCTVLEVLEPSSSDNEELFLPETSSLMFSKSANNTTKVTAKSQRVSTLVKLLEDCQHASASRQTNAKGHSYILPQKSNSRTSATREALTLEPPLSVIMTKSSEGLVCSKEAIQKSTNRTQNEKRNSLSEQKNVKGKMDDKSFSDRSADLSGTDISDAAETTENILESSPKKRGFLLKFSLKNRWSSKQKRTPKKLEEKLSTEAKVDVEKLSPSSRVASVDFRCNVAPLSEQFHSMEELTLQQHNHDRTTPKRREPPPPVPESASKGTANVSPGLSKESVDALSIVSNAKSEIPENQQFCSSPDEMSRLYGSTIKLDSRPPSSASRIDVTPRSEDSFKVVGLPLRKTLSASTELLVTPDCSTAGRQSPAQSEVSKTESALSPPSDVSKTESTRHLNQLGKIDESVKKPVEIMDMTYKDIAEDNQHFCFEQSPIVEQAKECRKLDKKTESSSKPWYEVSDDEDLLGPVHFQGNIRNNSEDEASAMLL